MFRRKRSRYARSSKLFDNASRFLPGGVDSPVRAFKGVGGTPVFIKRGSGSHIEDVDGNTYVDYVMSWGPLIHGHAPKGLRKALAAAAVHGTSFGAPTELETQLARARGEARAVDGADSIRELGNRSGDERSAGRARRSRLRLDHQVRRLLPRPRRRVSRPGGIGRDDTRRANQPGRLVRGSA